MPTISSSPNITYYLEQGEQIAVPTISSSPNITYFGAFERDINAMGYELRHYEISVDYNQIMSVIINLCTNKSEHPDKIMGVVAQHGMTTKEMHCNKLGDYLYYNIVAYIGGTFIPPVIRLDPIDPYQDELDNPLI